MTEDLKRLIDAIVADGIITEKERTVLHSRAQAEGMSPDEIDVLIDGMLVQRQNNHAQPSQINGMRSAAPVTPFSSSGPQLDSFGPTQPQSHAQAHSINHGVVNKCPNCGAVVASLSTSCEECGYVFRDIQANSSVQRLSQLIYEASSNLSHVADYQRLERINNIIRTFPVPSTKEDLVEFILFTRSKAYARSLHEVSSHTGAYKAKYRECLEKARFYFPDDPQVQRLLDDEKREQRNFIRNMHPALKIFLGVIVLFIFLIILGIILPDQ